MEKHGFEDELEFDQDVAHRWLRVRALDVHGGTLGISKPIDLGWAIAITDAVPMVPGYGRISFGKLILLFLSNLVLVYIVYQLFRHSVRRWMSKRRSGLYLYSPVLGDASV